MASTTDTNEAAGGTGQNIFRGATKKGLTSVGSYQVSGHPFITGSTNLDANTCHMVEFDYVSKSLTVINASAGDSGENIRVHFDSGSHVAPIISPGESGAKAIIAASDVYLGLHYITVPKDRGSVTLDVKCKRFYVSNPTATNNISYEVFAELTTIPTRSMFHLTGSGITEI